MTENASELTEAEREAFGLTHEDWCHDDCCGCICGLDERIDAVESILAARTAALRDEIAREIEAAAPLGRDAWAGLPSDIRREAMLHAADIARGGIQ